jgi:ribosome-interacting GTPase 1
MAATTAAAAATGPAAAGTGDQVEAFELDLDDELQDEGEEEPDDDDDRYRTGGPALPRTSKPAILVGAKYDEPDAPVRLELVREMLKAAPVRRLPFVPVSTIDGQGLAELRRGMFEMLEIIRVYTKAPGKKPDMNTPFVLSKGSTILEAASQVHKDFARDLKFARVWGAKVFAGQMVPRDHVLEDGDIIEFHV